MRTQHILIIEDDVDMSKIYQRILKEAGYSISLNQSGKDVIELIQEEKPDLLVLDVHLPYSWGPETVKKIRELPETAATKILITTVDVIVGNELTAAGETVLIKPVPFDRLQNTVEELLAK